MANYTFDDSVPATNNDPSVDQPVMLANNVSNEDIWDVDHVGFNASNGGTHKQINFFSNIAGSIGSANACAYPGTRPASYTNATGSGATNLYAINTAASSYPLPMSCIKAGGVIDVAGPTFDTQFNCASVAHPSGTTYTVTLQSGVTTGDNVIVSFMPNSVSSSASISYSFSAGVLSMTIGSGSATKISFLILQV